MGATKISLLACSAVHILVGSFALIAPAAYMSQYTTLRITGAPEAMLELVCQFWGLGMLGFAACVLAISQYATHDLQSVVAKICLTVNLVGMYLNVRLTGDADALGFGSNVLIFGWLNNITLLALSLWAFFSPREGKKA
eukprot:TRINITY_DN14114_c0_g1_i1.p2 TRINITY_DN14114_c0_g1~~TRINITY_DN14114_c0_g1_i1.p2  ORF type:complete len:139 (+),score=11.44 TRINITY_DN14114_c0_g1_i1:163-579(+)